MLIYFVFLSVVAIFAVEIKMKEKRWIVILFLHASIAR